MNDYYEDVVRNLYINLRPKFIRVLTAKYPSLRLDEAEDLYQDLSLQLKIIWKEVRCVKTLRGKRTLFKLESTLQTSI